jgi:ABC-2 type transport system ATP-binding protein
VFELCNLTKSYAKGTVKAVDDVTLRVEAGEIFGFLGPNGAGKTTTIKMLTGILAPDSGSVSVDSVNIAERPTEAKRGFGYVSDNPELFGRLKAKEYLNFMGDVYGVPTKERKERVERYSELFEIHDALNASISSFSRGMKQKLLVVGSLIHDPSNWILDEPMVGLDPKAAFDLKEEMRERAKAGKTVFFSTHVMEVAEKVCDRLAIIAKGKIVFAGTLDELRASRGSGDSLESLFLELVDDDAGGAE